MLGFKNVQFFILFRLKYYYFTQAGIPRKNLSIVLEPLENGRVRELYKATGGAWGGNKVNEAFIEYLCDVLTKEVIDTIKQRYPSEFVDMIQDFEQITSMC